MIVCLGDLQISHSQKQGDLQFSIPKNWAVMGMDGRIVQNPTKTRYVIKVSIWFVLLVLHLCNDMRSLQVIVALTLAMQISIARKAFCTKFNFLESEVKFLNVLPELVVRLISV